MCEAGEGRDQETRLIGRGGGGPSSGWPDPARTPLAFATSSARAFFFARFPSFPVFVVLVALSTATLRNWLLPHPARRCAPIVRPSAEMQLRPMPRFQVPTERRRVQADTIALTSRQLGDNLRGRLRRLECGIDDFCHPDDSLLLVLAAVQLERDGHVRHNLGFVYKVTPDTSVTVVMLMRSCEPGALTEVVDALVEGRVELVRGGLDVDSGVDFGHREDGR